MPNLKEILEAPVTDPQLAGTERINVKVTDLDELSLDDVSGDTKEHILEKIGEGFTSGEVCEYDADDNEQRGWWKMTSKGVVITLNN